MSRTVLKDPTSIASHAWSNNHCTDLENAFVWIDKGDYRVRKTLESWHTAKATDAETTPGK